MVFANGSAKQMNSQLAVRLVTERTATRAMKSTSTEAVEGENDFSITVLAGVALVRPKGRIDPAISAKIQTCVEQAIAGGARHVVVDLSQVPWLGRSARSTLDALFDMLHPRTCQREHELMLEGMRDGSFKSSHLKLLNPTPGAVEALHAAGYDMYLEIFRDPPGAFPRDRDAQITTEGKNSQGTWNRGMINR